MGTYKQLNLYNGKKLLIPTEIQLEQFCDDIIRLLYQRRNQHFQQTFAEKHEKISKSIEQTINYLENLEKEIQPKIKAMHKIANNDERSTAGTQLAKQYNPLIRHHYQQLINQLDQVLLEDKSQVFYKHYGVYSDKLKYRHVNQLIKRLRTLQDTVTNHPETFKQQLLTANVNPNTHLRNPTFLADVIKLHPEYQGIKLIQIQNEYVITRAKPNDYQIDYDDEW